MKSGLILSISMLIFKLEAYFSCAERCNGSAPEYKQLIINKRAEVDNSLKELAAAGPILSALVRANRGVAFKDDKTCNVWLEDF